MWTDPLRRFGHILAVVALGWAAGCAPTKPTHVIPANPVFYPSDVPRLQFLMTFNSAEPWISEPRSFSRFIAGDDAPVEGQIKSPYGLAARNGKLYVCDLAVHRIHVIDVVKKTYGVLGTRAQLSVPVNITIDADGTKYVCDTRRGDVAVFDADDRFVRHIGDRARCIPNDLAVLGEELIVVDVKDAEVEVWSKDGKLLRVIAEKGDGPGQLRTATNVAIGSARQIYVADTGASIVQTYGSDGRYLGPVGAPGDRPGYFARPKGLAVDPQGRLYVADAQWEHVQIFSPSKQMLLFFGGAEPGPQGMGLPAGISIDTTSVEAFKQFIDKDFEAEYLLFVANQFGRNKIGVYAFGKSKTADYSVLKRPRTTRPATPSSARSPSSRPATTPAQ